MNVQALKIGNVTIGGGTTGIHSRPMRYRVGEVCLAHGQRRSLSCALRKTLNSSSKLLTTRLTELLVRSFRGIGVREGCEILSAIGRDLKIPVTTDVHSPVEAEIAGVKIDMLQIPAFLCRQTDLLRAAAETGRAINVKKGQFLAPWDVRNIAEKLIAFGNAKFCFTERGTTFGYNNLVADMRSLYWLREAGYRVFFDATHSVQRPGGGGDSTSGDGILAPALARAAMATGCDGIFMEVHEHPGRALSDGQNQIPLKDLPKQLRVLKAIHAAVSGRGD